MQFSRDYQLTISYDNTEVVVQPPFRVTFDVFKSVEGGLNKATIEIYNLKESTRLKLVKDAEQEKLINLVLLVGYEGQLRQVYSGNVFKGENKRSSGVDFITHLETLDGGFDLFNGFVNKTVSGKDRALDQALSELETNKGGITRLSDLTRPKVMVGKTTKVIDSFLEEGQSWFINDGKLNIVKDGEVINQNFTPVISSESGLISTPTRQQQIIEFDTLVNPTIELGSQIELISTTAPYLNGIHKVITIETKGDYEGDDWTMSVKCIAGTYVPVG